MVEGAPCAEGGGMLEESQDDNEVKSRGNWRGEEEKEGKTGGG